MKRIIFLICIITIFSVTACGGNMKNVKVMDKESKIYTSDDINSAIEIIKKEFQKDWKGCTLKEIYYAGDDISKEYQDWADRYEADEVMVLLSSFDVDSSGGKGSSLSPNSTYDDWMWILVRTNGGKWKHVDHGY